MSIFNFRRGRNPILALGTLTAGAITAVGCLNPPVVEQQPNTSNVFVNQVVNTSITAIDLLFVIDNSVSMGDKQAILENAVPQMLERLLVPDCVEKDARGDIIGEPQTASLGAECPEGFEREFTPVSDIHVGVITSSLGSHGGDSCLADQQNDRSVLVPNVRSTLPDGSAVAPTEGDSGFLTWNPSGSGTDAEKEALKSSFANHVVAAGESGCGFEAPLEAWYRFLIDSHPAQAMEVNPQYDAAGNVVTESIQAPVIDGSGLTVDINPGESYASALDTQILEQRKQFLRQDSLVAIVLLTDENDCSAMDGGQYYRNSRIGWELGDFFNVVNGMNRAKPRPFSIASAECATDPNGECCYSCRQSQGSLPEACQAGYAESCPSEEEKQSGQLPPRIDARLGESPDEANARCVKNRQRFGLDFLYPTQRYVDGLTNSTVIDNQTGAVVNNPLLAGFEVELGADGLPLALRANGEPNEKLKRPEGLVFFAGIVGIPWQDLATEETLDANSDELEFLTADELSIKSVPEGQTDAIDRWDVILGTPGLSVNSQTCRDLNGNFEGTSCGQNPVAPLDPFMVESFEPRIGLGLNPITNTGIVTDLGDPTAAINGHEFVNEFNGRKKNDDLQYACIFPLQEAKPCAAEGCDCDDTGIAQSKPLCETPDGSAPAANTQYYAKAYPATRVLEVLKDFGENSIVGSICPKVSSGSTTAPGFGYNPAVKAIVDRLKDKLGGQCLPRELSIDEVTGEVPCTVVEAKINSTFANPDNLDCESTGRSDVSADIRTAVEKQLEESEFCGSNGVSCADYTLCEIKQLVYDETPGSEGDNCFFKGDDFYKDPAVNEAGYCYIDPSKGPAAGGEGSGCTVEDTEGCSNPQTNSCPASSPRKLRFVGGIPVKNAVTFVACVGESTGGGFVPKAEGAAGSSASQ
jgi:hypothetical protein